MQSNKHADCLNAEAQKQELERELAFWEALQNDVSRRVMEAMRTQAIRCNSHIMTVHNGISIVLSAEIEELRKAL